MPLSDATAAHVELVLQRHQARRDLLVQILREVQEQSRWLPREVLGRGARAVGLAPAIVEGVASFYRFFHLHPVGRHHLLFSDNVTDRMNGSRRLARLLCRQLGVSPGQVTPDGQASVGFTSCIGLGDQGPAVLVDQQRALTRMDEGRILQLAELLRGGPT